MEFARHFVSSFEENPKFLLAALQAAKMLGEGGNLCGRVLHFPIRIFTRFFPESFSGVIRFVIQRFQADT
jgi:hypothetical protein